MSFSERLRTLITQRIEESAEEQRQEERLRDRLAREERTRSAELETVAERIRQKFGPIFDSVKQDYLGGNGIISIEKAYPDVTLELDWGQYSEDDGSFYHYGGEQLRINLDCDSNIKIRGAGRTSPCVNLTLQDEELERKAEDAILSILRTPQACHHGSSGFHFDP